MFLAPTQESDFPLYIIVSSITCLSKIIIYVLKLYVPFLLKLRASKDSFFSE